MSSHASFTPRPYGKLKYRKLFIIMTEGVHTEPNYFGLIHRQYNSISIQCLKGKHSSPSYLLKQMKEFIKKEKLQKTDEAWLVIDKDEWTEEQLRELYEWSQGKENYGFALSNPHFEYWLLLHFENGDDIDNARRCIEHLKEYLPDYNKKCTLKFPNFQENIMEAIQRAKIKDAPPCTDWPHKTGTTVYKLLEKIIDST